jgi:hypothetical protein
MYPLRGYTAAIREVGTKELVAVTPMADPRIKAELGSAGTAGAHPAGLRRTSFTLVIGGPGPRSRKGHRLVTPTLLPYGADDNGSRIPVAAAQV